jgi:methylmalonyl-CoA mutase cobalamin-binding domain/chain
VPPPVNITDAIVAMDEAAALRLVEEKITSGVNPVDILEECRRGMSAVGERFEKGEMYLSELFMASEIFNQIMTRVKPLLGKSSGGPRGKIVIGTVEGDVHDIGKNIFVSLLEAEGYDVVDLGVDVPPLRFVEAIKEYKPDLVGMSSLLSTSLDAVKRTVDAITEAGLRSKVKIIVGGGRIDEQAADYIAPDAFTDNASQGMKRCRELLEEA